jgi:hypothetical protein
MGFITALPVLKTGLLKVKTQSKQFFSFFRVSFCAQCILDLLSNLIEQTTWNDNKNKGQI